MVLDDREQNLWAWIQERHSDHKRKYTGEPYANHLWEVAEFCYMYLGAGLHIPIALLHDTVEDKKATEGDVWKALITAGYIGTERRFILDGVRALTDVYTKEAFPELNREHRKSLEAARLGTIDPLFQSIKYADMTSNADDIAPHDPDFAFTYLKEMRRALDLMRLGNINLLIGACSAVVDAERTLAQQSLAPNGR